MKRSRYLVHCRCKKVVSIYDYNLRRRRHKCHWGLDLYCMQSFILSVWPHTGWESRMWHCYFCVCTYFSFPHKIMGYIKRNMIYKRQETILLLYLALPMFLLQYHVQFYIAYFKEDVKKLYVECPGKNQQLWLKG